MVMPSPSQSPVETDPSRDLKLQIDGTAIERRIRIVMVMPSPSHQINVRQILQTKVQVDGKGERKNSNGNGHAEPKSPKSPRESQLVRPMPRVGSPLGHGGEGGSDEMGCRPRANSTDGELNLPQGGLCDERKVLQAHKWNLDKQD
jgi:hypothetical protein